MAIVSRLILDHPALDDPGGAPLHTQVEGLYIKIGDNLSARYFESIALGIGATATFDHNFKMPFDEIATKIYLLAGAGGELTVTAQTDYDVVATPGFLTTKIDVTNNSGGVVTIAMLMQSIGGLGGGGGQLLYDVVVDAGGDGDYTSLADAVNTEAVERTIFVRNGIYTETANAFMKVGQHIIGESNTGVVINYQGPTNNYFIEAPRLTSALSRGRSTRNSENSDWDSGVSVGLVTLTHDSTTATYSGPTAPILDDICCIGPAGDLFDIVGVGVGTVTLDRPWRGDTTTTDWMVLQDISDVTSVDWKQLRSSARNLTINVDGAFTGPGAIRTVNSWNFDLKDCILTTTRTDASTIANVATSFEAHITMENILIKSAGAVGNVKGINLSGANCQLRNIVLEGCKNNSIVDIKYFDIHFISISQIDPSDLIFVFVSNMLHTKLSVDHLQDVGAGFFPAETSSQLDAYGCDFVFGHVSESLNGDLNLNCAASMVSIKKGFHTTNTNIGIRDISSRGLAQYYNVLHDSFLQGPIEISNASESNLIIGGDVRHSGFASAFKPAFDNGYDHTSPPAKAYPLYDHVVDAGGGGDFTLISLAVNAAADDQTIYIRNGTYVETSTINIKQGQKLIGESMDGVVLQNSGAHVFLLPRMSFERRGRTQRLADNTDWDDTTSVGRITVTKNSASATYSGPTAVVANDTCVIGPGWTNKYDLSNAGVGTIDLDRSWEGTSGTYDWVVWRNPDNASWKTQETIVRNMKIESSGLSSARIFEFQNTVGCLVENILIETNAFSSSSAVIYAQNDDPACNTFRNIVASHPNVQGGPFFYFNGACVTRLRLENCRSNGLRTNRLAGQAAFPQHYLYMHFIEIASSDSWMQSISHVSHSTFKWDTVTDCTGNTNLPAAGASLSAIHTFWEIGEWTNSGNFNLGVAKSRVSIQNTNAQFVTINVPGTWEADYEYRNVLHDSYINGSIEANSVDGKGLIISSSVLYDNLNDPSGGVIDRGVNWNSPPVGGSGQTLYDIIVDAAGGGDFTDIRTGVQSAAAGQTVYVRNGAYDIGANFITNKENVKVIGESHGGVIVETTNAVFIRPQTGGNWNVRCFTKRLSTNLGWDAVNDLGTLTLAFNSPTILYSGLVAPVIGDAIIIGKSFAAEVISVGVGTFNIDRDWNGTGTTSGDGIVSSKLPLDFNDETLWKNIVFDHRNATGSLLVECSGTSGLYGYTVRDCTYICSNSGGGTDGIFASVSNGDSAKIRLEDCTVRNLDNGGPPFDLNLGTHVDFEINRCRNIGCVAPRYFANADNAQRYNKTHWSSWSGGHTSAFGLIRHQYRSQFYFENVIGLAQFTTDGGSGAGVEDIFECDIKFTNSKVLFMAIKAGNSIVELGVLEGTSVSLTENSGTGLTNILTNTLLPTQTLTVDGSVVISGSTAYKVLAGVPAQNNGYDIP